MELNGPHIVGRAAWIAFLVLCVCFSAIATGTPSLDVFLFASSTCEGCKEIKTNLFPKVKARFGDAVNLVHIPVDDIEAVKMQLQYEALFGIDDDEALKVFAGKTCLSGLDAISEKLEVTISDELAKGNVTPPPGSIASKSGTSGQNRAAASDDMEEVIRRFGSFKWTAIALAGLIDGINPCAFTTLIFFISLLSALGKGRQDMLVVGLCFAAAVFATYFLLGLGLFKAIKVVSVNAGVARGITLGVAGLTLAFAGYSFHDYFAYRRTRKGESMALTLPEKIRTRIRTLISRQMRTRNLVIGALGLGVVISLLEAVCTGQVYLPTIMCVARDRNLAGKALSYLTLYNLMFVTPLMGVFGIAYCGVSSERMAAFSRQNVGKTKVLLGLLFLGLAGILLASIF